MTHPSETLRSLVASKSPEELKIWAQQRLSGDDRMPLLYQGKEVEHPHEAVAAVFGLEQEVLTPAKRGVVIETLKNVRRTIQEEWVEGKFTDQSTKQAIDWAEVISLAKPEELRNDARIFLDACLIAPPEAQSALPEIAAAATDFAETGEPDLVLWNKLLGKPQTAALAFRRLLATQPFPQMSQHWLTLLKMRLRYNWPANVRLLTATLLAKAPSTTFAIRQLASLVAQSGLSRQAADELSLSKNESVKALGHELEINSVSFDLDSWLEQLRHQTRVPQKSEFYSGRLNYSPRYKTMDVQPKYKDTIAPSGRMILNFKALCPEHS